MANEQKKKESQSPNGNGDSGGCAALVIIGALIPATFIESCYNRSKDLNKLMSGAAYVAHADTETGTVYVTYQDEYGLETREVKNFNQFGDSFKLGKEISLPKLPQDKAFVDALKKTFDFSTLEDKYQALIKDIPAEAQPNSEITQLVTLEQLARARRRQR